MAAAGSSGRWVDDFSAGVVKAIGAVEVLAAAGLLLPAVLGIAPVLVSLAALGLVMLMLGTAVTRFRRHDRAHCQAHNGGEPSLRCSHPST
ncbi:DoxX family protein [Peterkaempfera sp. SMS 1(5)a]|uniref:DoxX family protein n=1 Tax=Peterkaempfera podocarpi TaxID=3232308 RepID=UPI003671D1B3